MDAVKRSKLNAELAMQYLLETPVVELPVTAVPEIKVPSKETVHEPIKESSTQTVHSESKGEDSEDECDQKDKKKKPSVSALKRKIPQVKETIPDATDDIIFNTLLQVNGDVDKCILMLLEDPDVGTRVNSSNAEPLPSDDSCSDSMSDDEIDSTGSFGKNMMRIRT